MPIDDVNEAALVEDDVVALRRRTAASGLRYEKSDFPGRRRICDIDYAQARAEPYRKYDRACHAFVKLVGAKSCPRGTGKRRVEFAHPEHRNRPHVFVVADVENRHACMQPAPTCFLLIGILRLIFFIDGDRDPSAAQLDRRGHDGVRGLREWRMVIAGRDGPGSAQIGDIDDTETTVPAARPHLVTETQRVMQAVTLTRPCR